MRNVCRKADEMLRDYQLADAIPPWYSPVQPKPVYKDDKVKAYWNVPVSAGHLQVRVNRVEGEQGDDADRDELSLDGQQKTGRRRGDLKVRAFVTRAQETAPRVQDSTV